MNKLNEGDEYLTVSILGQLKVSAFANKDRPKGTEPHYIGNGIAIWKNTKKGSD